MVESDTHDTDTDEAAADKAAAEALKKANFLSVVRHIRNEAKAVEADPDPIRSDHLLTLLGNAVLLQGYLPQRRVETAISTRPDLHCVVAAIDGIDSGLALLQCATWATEFIEDGNPIAAAINAAMVEIEEARTELETVRDGDNV